MSRTEPPVRLVDLLHHNDPRHGWWVAVDGRVYDVTDFVRRHPGGAQILQAHAGLDATASFHRAHRDPEAFAHLRHSLYLGCTERPVEGQRLLLRTAYALVELQNTLRLDRSFGRGTRLCDAAGTEPSGLQIDRASDTLDRFHDHYLPDLICEVRALGPDVGSVALALVDAPAHLHAGVGERSPAVLRIRLDALEHRMAGAKSELLAGLTRAGTPLRFG